MSKQGCTSLIVQKKAFSAVGSASLLLLLLLIAAVVLGGSQSSAPAHTLHARTRSLLFVPTTTSVLDSSVVQPGPATAAAKAAAQVAAEEVLALDNQLSSFALRESDLNPAFLPKRVYPIERGICGTWMNQYAELHRDILQGRRPPRYSIFRQDRNGLTDRLISSVTVFLHALLTDRAFLLDWHGEHSLWGAYRSSYIDWRYDKDRAPEKDAAPGQVLLLDFMGADRQGAHAGPEHAVFYKWFTQTQLEDVGSNATHLIWTVNRGLAWKATYNPYIKQRLKAMGLNPINIFACLFDYLYRPTPGTISLVRPMLPQLLDPSLFKVGLQIRTGDMHLGGGQKAKTFEEAFEWFHCAQVAEQHWKPPGQKSIWFLLSDSPEIRSGARKYLGDQVVTMNQAVLAHTLYIPEHYRNNSGAVLGFAAAETWLFSLMDVHLISHYSGFGRMGAMIAASWDHTVQLPAGMWSLSGFEAKLTYIAQAGEVSTAERTVVSAENCPNPSRSDGPAFCWPQDPEGPPPPLDGNSPMSVKIRHMCSKTTPMADIVKAHTGVKR